MQYLEAVLVVKIVFTIILWVIPPLLCSAQFLKRRGFRVPEPKVFLRLLGMSYLALAVGYVHGLQLHWNGIYPANTVLVGIVSNGGAFVLLAIAAFQSAWKEWGAFARGIMWISLGATGLITLGLIVCGPLRQPV